MFIECCTPGCNNTSSYTTGATDYGICTTCYDGTGPTEAVKCKSCKGSWILCGEGCPCQDDALSDDGFDGYSDEEILDDGECDSDY